jgi:hypothetical protein
MNAIHTINGHVLFHIFDPLHELHLAHDQQLILVTTQVPFVDAVIGGPHKRVGRAAEDVKRF